MSTVTLHIPKRAHFDIIGRGGATVRDLQAKFKVRVQVPRQEERSTAVTVTGAAADVAAARAEIEKIIGFAASDRPLRVAALAVSSNDHGKLIGKGGAVAKKLQAEFGIDLSIPRDSGAAAGEPVLVTGEPGAVDKAIAEIGNLLGYKPAVSDGNAAAAAAAAAGPRGPGARGGESKETVARTVDYSQPINEALFFPDTDGSDGFAFDRLSQLLASAETGADCCVFTIADDRLSKILLLLHKKGSRVRIISDNDCAKNEGSDVIQLARAGIPTKLDVTEFHMHHKFAVLRQRGPDGKDAKLLITGSYNWTRSASTRNEENILVTNHADLIAAYERHFAKMWADDKAFQFVK